MGLPRYVQRDGTPGEFYGIRFPFGFIYVVGGISSASCMTHARVHGLRTGTWSSLYVRFAPTYARSPHVLRIHSDLTGRQDEENEFPSDQASNRIAFVHDRMLLPVSAL